MSNDTTSKRGTGRTGRMLDYAIFQAQFGPVVVVALDRTAGDTFRRIIDDRGATPYPVTVEVLRDLQHLREYKLRIAWAGSVIDPDPHRDKLFLVDHACIEAYLATGGKLPTVWHQHVEYFDQRSNWKLPRYGESTRGTRRPTDPYPCDQPNGHGSHSATFQAGKVPPPSRVETVQLVRELVKHCREMRDQLAPPTLARHRYTDVLCAKVELAAYDLLQHD